MTGQSGLLDGAARAVLEGVPRVGFYFEQQQHPDSQMRCPEDVPLPSCLRACLEYLGDGLGCRQIGVCHADRGLFCAYAYLLGVTGAAFLFDWKPDWREENAASILVADDSAEIIRRGFAAAGYQFEAIRRDELQQQGRHTEEYLRSRIIESIRERGRPVIARGVVGPPVACIITGYDEGGDVLIGWSFFQGLPEFSKDLEFETNGYFRKRDWYPDTWDIVLIGDKQKPPSPEEVYREALGWALEVTRTPDRHGDRHNGLAAYDAWAEHLLRDDDFATDDMSVLNQRFQIHDDAVGAVAEGRWYASVFLTQVATTDPGVAVPPLFEAAACYATEHDLMWEVWGLVGGIGHSPDKVRKLGEREVRRQIVSVIQRARDKDREAAEHLEAALQGGSTR